MRTLSSVGGARTGAATTADIIPATITGTPTRRITATTRRPGITTAVITLTAVTTTATLAATTPTPVTRTATPRTTVATTGLISRKGSKTAGSEQGAVPSAVP